MGALTSKHFTDMLEESDSQQGEGLPVTPTVKRILQDCDPRSPTQGIVRTPIHLEKEPELLFDPRSPTCGIDRTPIYCKQGPTGEEQTITDCISPGHLGETPSLATASFPPERKKLDLGTDECDVHSDTSVELMSRSISEPDLSVDKEILIKPRKSTTPGKITKRTSVSKKHKPKALFQGHTNTGGESCHNPTAGSKGKDAVRSPLRVLAADSDQRSPLGRRNVDVNSPRVIVQRKQTTKLSLLRGKNNNGSSAGNVMSCRYEAMSDDKENISM